MKVLAISDLHGLLPPIGACDVLIIAGDVCPFDDHGVVRQADFLNNEFADWLDRVPAAQIVGIAGNHDFVFERTPHLVGDRLRWTYLHDREATIGGLRVFGTPWCPPYRRWAFNLDEQRLAEKYSLVPEGLDVLIAHCPPRGYGDRVMNGESVGSTALADRVRVVAPRLMVVGHVHEARGSYQMPVSGGGTTAVLNVSHLDSKYEPRHGTVELDLSDRDASAAPA